MAKTLVLYFSATGTTKRVAELIAQKTDADLAVIHPEQPYTSADLDWHDSNSRTSVEQHEHNSRVAIKDDLPDLSNYDNVLIGSPIWWGIPPRMIASVIDHLNFNGQTLAGFATSGGSDYSRAQSFVSRALSENGGKADLKSGRVLSNSHDIDQWLKEIGIN